MERLDAPKFTQRAIDLSSPAGLHKIERLRHLDYRVTRTPSGDLRKDPDFSLILIVHDREIEYVRSAVQSALNQDHQNFEVCLIDNGTTGTVAKFLASEVIQQDRVTLISLPFHFYDPATREIDDPTALLWCAGLYVARGRITYFLSNDDVLSTNYISEVVRVFDGDDRCMTVAPRVVSINNRGEINEARTRLLDEKNQLAEYTEGPEVLRSLLQGRPKILAPGGILAVDRDLAISMGGFDKANDLTQFLKFAPHGSTGFASEATLFWRHHEGQANRAQARRGLVYYESHITLADTYSLPHTYRRLGLNEEASAVGPFLKSHASTVALEAIRDSLRNYGLMAGLRAVKCLLREGGWRLVPKSLVIVVRNIPAAIKYRVWHRLGQG